MSKRSWLYVVVVLFSCTQKEYSGPISDEFEPDVVEIESIRTPEKFFHNLPDYNFTPHYMSVGSNLRMHYLDENPSAEKVAVLLHGEPTWSYTYRHMIPVLMEAGYRVIVPDMIGFGKSDKPVRENDHTYQRHVNWMRTLLFDSLQLKNINFFLQDFGGMVGLSLVAEHPERINSVVLANTAFPTGDQIPGEAFLKWQETLQNLDPFPVGKVVQWGCTSTLEENVLSAYDAPFPDDSYKAAARILPLLIPTSSNDLASKELREAWVTLRRFNKPVLALYGASSHITRGWYKTFQKKIPGAKRQPHELITDGGFFLAEDSGEYLALKMISFIANAE